MLHTGRGEDNEARPRRSARIYITIGVPMLGTARRNMRERKKRGRGEGEPTCAHYLKYDAE